MRIIAIVNLLLLTLVSNAQNKSIGLFGGVSHYQGDLSSNAFVTQLTKPVVGLTGTYDITRRFSLRAALNFAQVAGHDKYQDQYNLRQRNLSFQSNITEAGIHAVYNVFNLGALRWTPYFFGGIAVYHFNPWTKDSAGVKTYLKPLSTEGQGLEQYPDRKPYKLTQLALPLGAGIKYVVNDRVQLGLELGVRKLFTDYLDDISKNYADQADLMAAKGPKAVELAYRGDEGGGDPAYPAKNAQRGGSEVDDWYYFTGLHINFYLGKDRGSIFGSRNRKGLDCPRISQ